MRTLQPLQILIAASKAIPAHLASRKDVPFRDIGVLCFILDHKDPVSSPDIQTGLGISQPKVVTIMTRLKGYGVVEQYEDARGRTVYAATAQGAALREALQNL